MALMWQDLPADLILDILTLLYPEPKLSTSDPHLFPWYLGQICSHWRFVFISTPRFWSTITVNPKLRPVGQFSIPDHQPLLAVRAVEIVQICTERGQDHPLTLTIDALSIAPSRCSPWSSCYDRMLEMLVADCVRWRDVRLRLHYADMAILHKAKGNFPTLRSLEIMLFANETPEPFVELFLSAPCLSRLHVENISHWNFSWSSITTLKIGALCSAKPEEFRRILQQTHRLEKLILMHPLPPMSLLPKSIAPVTLPYLKILCSNTAAFLALVQAPALESLWLNLPGPSSIHQLCLPFTATFFGAVRYLKYMMLSLRCVVGAQTIVQHIPKVDHLHILADRWDVGLPSCPNARHFKRLSISLDASSRAALATEIAACASLDVVSLDIIRSFSHQHYAGLDKLKKHCRDRGIRLLIRYFDRFAPVPSPGEMEDI